MIETFRSALETIDKIQKESALSLGMTKWQTMRYVILPQSFVISLPGLTANIIFMLVVGYLIILLPLSLLGVWLERKLKYVGYSN